MDMHDAIEQAYKNGYKKGAKDYAERLKAEMRKYCGEITEDDIYDLLKEMESK